MSKPSTYIEDFISGQTIKATPEELDAVQVFARRLVEDFGYTKDHIQTRPQFRVRKTPSDSRGTYPVDIAVFSSSARIEQDLFMVVECKQKGRREGLNQLKRYLDMCPATIGVWFNGDDHVYLRKVLSAAGQVQYREIPNIPKAGQRIEDIGKHQRRDLVKPSNLKAVFRDIRNHLAGNATGITRDEALAQEIINILFCKIYDEINTGPDEPMSFRCGVDETPDVVKQRLVSIFEDKVKRQYDDVFESSDVISLDARSLAHVVGELQTYCVTDADRDAVGDAFEVFIGPALRGAEGQFFTPRNVVQMLMEIVHPQPGEMIIDPACGSGGFLIAGLEHVWGQLEEAASTKGWNPVQLDRQKRDVASKCFRGLDKDSFLAKVTKAYMAIVGDGRGGVFCENSLQIPAQWADRTRARIGLGMFDVVVTNPPFGKKIKVRGAPLLAQYDLAYKWATDRSTGAKTRTNKLHKDRPPQILFLERCLQLLKPGGRLGIIIPESTLGNPSHEYVMAYLREHTVIKCVITMPEPLFKTSGKGGTHTKVCALVAEKRRLDPAEPIFMAAAKWCGHDSRGNPTIRESKDGRLELLDDVPLIAARYSLLRSGAGVKHDHLGFWLERSAIRHNIFVPKYYNPELEEYLGSLTRTHELQRISDLEKAKVVSIRRGIEVGKMAYGTGDIPFIRTSDISNWEIKADFKHGVSEAIYEQWRSKIDVQAGDILFVKDGTYLVGTTAIVTKSDLPMLFQSHIYRIRVEKPDVLSPWLIFACLNSPVVKRQVRSKQFTQDIIDTIGKRIVELRLPIPVDPAVRERIAKETEENVETRIALRNRTSEIARFVETLGNRDDVPNEELDPT